MEEFMYTSSDVDTWMSAATRLVSEAGAMIVAAIDEQKRVEVKAENAGESHAAQVLTETDAAVEQHLVTGLKSLFPDHGFIGEEAISAVGSSLISTFGNVPTWIIDPIDGTMNFVHKNPLVCTSVGLAVNRRLVGGIVNCPLIAHRYSAVKGRGAFLNDKRVFVSGAKTVREAMVVLELPAGASEAKRGAQLENVSRLMVAAHAIRCPGPAAMDIAFVGAGAADVFYHEGIHCWDMAAGALIVTEAGGAVANTDGSEFNLMGRNMIAASSAELIKEIVPMLKNYNVDKEFTDHCPI